MKKGMLLLTVGVVMLVLARGNSILQTRSIESLSPLNSNGWQNIGAALAGLGLFWVMK